jgi:hypothetical protein
MNSALEHHVIVFPDCQLRFDLPGNLAPSADFLHQRLLTTVDYDRLPWLHPNVSASLVSLQAEVPDRLAGTSLATVAIEMWLCAALGHFGGDVRDPDDLRRANAALDRAERLEPRPLVTTVIQGRTWLYRDAAGAYLIGLNRHLYLCARVSVAGGRDEPAVRKYAADLRDTIIGSLRVDPLAAFAAANPS